MSDGPNVLVTQDRHLADLFDFFGVVEVAVGSPATTVSVHAVEHAEVIAPEPRFVLDGLVQQRIGGGDTGVGTEQLLHDDGSEFAITCFGQVHAVDRQRFVGGLEPLRGGCVEIDEADVFFIGDRTDGIRVRLEDGVSLVRVGEIELGVLLHRDRSGQHQTRWFGCVTFVGS